jgi:hypothetical protein
MHAEKSLRTGFDKALVLGQQATKTSAVRGTSELKYAEFGENGAGLLLK